MPPEAEHVHGGGLCMACAVGTCVPCHVGNHSLCSNGTVGAIVACACAACYPARRNEGDYVIRPDGSGTIVQGGEVVEFPPAREEAPGVARRWENFD